MNRILDTPFNVNAARFLRHSEDIFAIYEDEKAALAALNAHYR